MNNRERYNNIINNIGLQDEERISKALKQKGFYSASNTYPLSSLLFELTSFCNCNCRHCYNKSGGLIESTQMSPRHWQNFAKYLIEKGGLFECLISGGEPFLLGDELLRLMDILHNDGTIFTLETNGYFITDSIVNRLSNYLYHWLQISIDGVSKVYHDNFRRLQGSWDRAVKSAEMISNAGIPLKIAHIVTPYNLYDVGRMCEMAFRLGASNIIIGEVCLSGRAHENPELLLSKKERLVLTDFILENRAKYEGRMIVKSSNSVKSGLLNHAQHPRSGAVIRPNGDIRIDGMAPFIIGNILKDDFTMIWEKKIDCCWKDPRVQYFISTFEEDDRNREMVNYCIDDILL